MSEAGTPCNIFSCFPTAIHKTHLSLVFVFLKKVPPLTLDLVEAETIVSACLDMSILARLQFVQNLILGRGGEKANLERDPVLVVAGDILGRTIEIMKEWPMATKWPKPEPGFDLSLVT